ncbi:coiled-coil domain-containing protein 187 isoform X2 [Paramisgurnus dabryanus]|uniref:coiled-coil domain-containing protein 187 isoform X2 n=1 Tax=Paramisgurnus dabryanus TaxID=90735 RepID=UPI0031F3E9EF
MMAELEVDQSNLPRVQEVCQCFAVLEDGALAHNLQEQEIEQHYTSNVQRNQLVQKDIRVAKTLQDEEKHTALLLQQQATRKLEERDSEYAQMIQEEIRRRAEEARRREVEDEEIAKRIQEEEELCVRNRGSYHNRDGRETTSLPPYSPRSVHPSEDRYYNRSPTRRWQHSFSPPYSDSEEDLIEHRRPTNSSQAYQDSRSTVGQRIMGRTHLDLDNSSTTSQSDSTVSQRSRTSHLSGGWGDVIKVIKTDLNEQGYLSHSSEDELFEPIYRLEKMLKQKQRSNRGTRLSRHSSVREDHSRTWHGDGCGRVESFRDGERRVRFQDERRRTNSYHGNGYSSIENGHDARERSHVGTLSPVVLRGNHAHTRESLGDQPQIPTEGFRRNVSMRRSYHGDVRLSRRTSVRGERRTSNQDDSNLVSRVRPHLMEMDERPLRETGRWEAARNQRQRARPLSEERINDTHYPRQHRARRSQSEHLGRFEEERSSSEEELEREMRRMQRHPSHSTHSPRAGPVAGRSGMAALDLGELEQVLLDEELARRLQEEEVKLVEEESSPRQTCPRDFRLAQVAQDEEIARFIQKQEIKAKRRSAELDPVGPGREYRNMVTEYDRRELQRERTGSDGLHSPVDNFPTDHQLSSPVSMAAQPQSVRNIAEELDPTFQRQEIADAGLRMNGTCQNQGPQQVDSPNPAEEQPTFVPPTKRLNEKLGRAKPKDKKENIKQKENCKQQ